MRAKLLVVLFAAGFTLAGCGGGGGSTGGSASTTGGGSTPTYSVGGKVTGLTSGTQVTLLDNGGNALTVSADGSFQFSAPIASGTQYSVTVGTQPTGQTCTVNGGSGTISGNVTNVAVNCSASTYTVGGKVTGLTSGTQVTLLDNGGDALTVSADGSFQFSAPITSGTQYAVTVGTQPTGQTCTVSGGSGTISADVTNVTVTCSASTTTAYTVGGTVTALPSGETVVLKNNGTDPITLYATGAFTFPNAVAYGASYSVTTFAPGEVCSVTNGSGTASANVSNVSVSCAGGVESILYSFQGGTDGAVPAAGLIMDAHGNLYGTTSSGGYNNSSDGTVFKLTPGTGGTYTETILHYFGASQSDGIVPLAGLIMDANGNLYGTTKSGGPVANGGGAGTVFKLTPGSGGTYTENILYSFGPAADGQYPEAGIIMDASGNIYGTTVNGGAYNFGTVFKLTPVAGGAYTETVLYSFKGGTTDGEYPRARLVMDANGNLYGTTNNGGIGYTGVVDWGDGTAFELTPGSGGTYTETILHYFGGPGDGSRPLAGLIIDAHGNLYGTTNVGGANNDGTVFELTPGSGGAYTETILLSFGGPGDGSRPLAGLIMDAYGTLYGTTTAGGGLYKKGVVFKLTPWAGGAYTETVLYSFAGDGTSSTDGSVPEAGLIMDANGNLYGTTSSGGTGGGAGTIGDGTVFKIN